jgi:hypothetical protein
MYVPQLLDCDLLKFQFVVVESHTLHIFGKIRNHFLEFQIDDGSAVCGVHLIFAFAFSKPEYKTALSGAYTCSGIPQTIPFAPTTASVESKYMNPPYTSRL